MGADEAVSAGEGASAGVGASERAPGTAAGSNVAAGALVPTVSGFSTTYETTPLSTAIRTASMGGGTSCALSAMAEWQLRIIADTSEST